MGILSWLKATLSARPNRQPSLLERGHSLDDDNVSQALETAMAMEQSQRLMRRWDRHWFGLPKQQRADADLLERYEWVYGRAMGNRDELLQRLRAGAAREPIIEYSTAHGDVAGSSSTGLLSNAAMRTPTSAHAEDTGRRTSFFFDTSSTDFTRDIADFMRRKDSSNSWRFRIWPAQQGESSPSGSFASPTDARGLSSEFSGSNADAPMLSPQRAGAPTPPPPVPRAPTPQQLTSAARSTSSPSELQPRARGHGSDGVAAGPSHAHADPVPSPQRQQRRSTVNDAVIAAGTQAQNGTVADVQAPHRSRPAANASAGQPARESAPSRKTSSRELAKVPSAKLREDVAARRARLLAAEEKVAKDAWNWRFTRKWISERNRAGIDVDDEGRAFKAILAGELTDVPASNGRSSNLSGPSRTGTLSESLMFPGEQPAAAGRTRSGRVSVTSDRLPYR